MFVVVVCCVEDGIMIIIGLRTFQYCTLRSCTLLKWVVGRWPRSTMKKLPLPKQQSAGNRDDVVHPHGGYTTTVMRGGNERAPIRRSEPSWCDGR